MFVEALSRCPTGEPRHCQSLPIRKRLPRWARESQWRDGSAEARPSTEGHGKHFWQSTWNGSPVFYAHPTGGRFLVGRRLQQPTKKKAPKRLLSMTGGLRYAGAPFCSQHRKLLTCPQPQPCPQVLHGIKSSSHFVLLPLGRRPSSLQTMPTA